MNNIIINFNKELVSDMKIFELFMNDLQNLYPNQVTFDSTVECAFNLFFNEKLIYSLEDSFDEELSIDKDILDKSIKYIENSINLSNSRNIPLVDDIGIVDY
jgi:hypothetical protein